MILLDTNVVSEPMKPAPAPAVLQWLDAQAPESLYLSTISQAELLAGVARLPSGKRKRGLQDALAELLHALFEGRILPFDSNAAEQFAKLIPHAQSRGTTIGFADGCIAAIAKTHRLAVATRDGGAFRAAGLTVIDPWTD
ncbi:MAG: type II toxin-antitoxin system VapC family toxin [Nevskia sp.]|nr:type II toxin-antitoxin system VapC family toxin [Nevskia sp.]